MEKLFHLLSCHGLILIHDLELQVLKKVKIQVFKLIMDKENLYRNILSYRLFYRGLLNNQTTHVIEYTKIKSIWSRVQREVNKKGCLYVERISVLESYMAIIHTTWRLKTV
ncbi:MAG: hypothetical protein ACLUVC_05500 [Longibaculum sp.]